MLLSVSQFHFFHNRDSRQIFSAHLNEISYRFSEVDCFAVTTTLPKICENTGKKFYMRIEYDKNRGYVFCVDNDKIPSTYLFNISENVLCHIWNIWCKIFSMTKWILECSVYREMDTQKTLTLWKSFFEVPRKSQICQQNISSA